MNNLNILIMINKFIRFNFEIESNIVISYINDYIIL